MFELSIIAQDIWVRRNSYDRSIWTDFIFVRDGNTVMRITVFGPGNKRPSINICNTWLVPLKTKLPSFFSSASTNQHNIATVKVTDGVASVSHLEFYNKDGEQLANIVVINPSYNYKRPALLCIK